MCCAGNQAVAPAVQFPKLLFVCTAPVEFHEIASEQFVGGHKGHRLVGIPACIPLHGLKPLRRAMVCGADIRDFAVCEQLRKRIYGIEPSVYKGIYLVGCAAAEVDGPEYVVIVVFQKPGKDFVVSRKGETGVGLVEVRIVRPLKQCFVLLCKGYLVLCLHVEAFVEVQHHRASELGDVSVHL